MDFSSSAPQLLATGGSDGVVQIWVVSKLNVKKCTMPCAQTLTGFGGTVTALRYLCAGPGAQEEKLQNSSCAFVTTSTDHTLKLWELSPLAQRATGLNKPLPQFECTRQLAQVAEGWFTCIDFAPVTTSLHTEHHLYVGDSQGILHVVTGAIVTTAETTQNAPRRSQSGSQGNIEEANLDTVGNQSQRGNGNKIEVRQFGIHSLGIFQIRFLKDHAFLATLSHDAKCRVFDCLRCATFATFANKRSCKYTSLGCTGKAEIYLGDESGYFELWNIRSETCLFAHRLGSSIPNVPASFHGPVISTGPSKALLNLSSLLCEVEVIQDLSFQEYHEHEDRVISICCFPGTSGVTNEGSQAKKAAAILTASYDNTIKSWDWYSMKPLFTLRERQSEISCMSYVPEIHTLLTGGEDGSVRYWNVGTGATTKFRHHNNLVSAMHVVWRSANALLLTADYDGVVGVWSITKKESVSVRLDCIFKAHEGVVSPIFGSLSDTEILAIRYCEGRPRRFSGTGFHGLPKTEQPVFFTAGNDAIVRIWHLVNCTVISELKGHTAAVTCLEVSTSKERKLCSGSEDASVRVWDIQDFKHPRILLIINYHEGPVVGLASFSVGTALLCASCSRDKTIKVSKFQDGESQSKILHEFSGEDYSTIAVAENRGEILAGTEDGKLLVYPFTTV